MSNDSLLPARVMLMPLPQSHADLISHEPEIGPEDTMPREYLDAFTALWEDKNVQMAILKGNEYALHDNLS